MGCIIFEFTTPWRHQEEERRGLNGLKPPSLFLVMVHDYFDASACKKTHKKYVSVPPPHRKMFRSALAATAK